MGDYYVATIVKSGKVERLGKPTEANSVEKEKSNATWESSEELLFYQVTAI